MKRLKRTKAQNLPFGILQKIFQHCLPTVDNPELNHQPNPSFAPLLLCHICVSWRIAAFSISTLWKSTTFTMHNALDSAAPSNRLLLRRSSDFIAWWKVYFGDVAPSLYLRALPAHSRRNRNNSLKSLKTALFPDSFFRSAHSLQFCIFNQELDMICHDPTPFPNLCELRIENAYNHNSAIPLMTSSHFPPGPRLTRLTPLSRRIDQGPYAAHLSMGAAYSSLPATNLSFDDFETLIQRCANVKVVAFIKYGQPPVDKPDGRIVVENLRQFVIVSNEYIMRISLSAFLFPNLTAFRFVVEVQTYDFFREMADLEGVFTAMPALRELRFDVPMLFGEVAGSYLPHLEYFIIDSIEPNGKNVGANIIKILRSDWLCSGWESPCERKLELIVSKSRFPDPVVDPSQIIAEVSAFLQSHWHFDSTPFEVSIRAEESERSAFDVFEEEIPSKRWNQALGFYTTI